MSLPEWTFWSLVLLIAYIYLGYPVGIYLLSRLFPRPIRKGPCEPTVSILIAAHNEARHLGCTIQNKLALDYPREKLEIIVVSDCSTDQTDHIVQQYAHEGVKLLRQVPRQGKTAALNLAVREARGDVLVFADANSMYERETLRALVANFHDPDVGYVTGRTIYVNAASTPTGEGCSNYMRYENLLRESETRIGSVVGVNGGVDAVRACLYEPMRADQLSDLILPLEVVEKGYRVVFEPGAVLREEVTQSPEHEYKMRVRVALRALWALMEMGHLLNVFRYGVFSVQMFSHKFLRYLSAWLLVFLYMINGVLASAGGVYLATFIVSTVFVVCSYIGYRADRDGRTWSVVHLPYYFCLVNLASCHAFLKLLNGTRQVTWHPRTG